MTDLLYLGIVFIFFAASWAFIIGCEKLMEEWHEFTLFVTGLIALVLLVYLILALLKPEWFG